MGADLQSVVAALANLTDSELNALIDAIKNVPQVAPGFLAWLDAAFDWELHRRQGQDCAPRPPALAIAPEEDAASIYTVVTIRALFGEGVHRVRVLFDALVGLLTGAGPTH
jgi:hypothetical protein